MVEKNRRDETDLKEIYRLEPEVLISLVSLLHCLSHPFHVSRLTKELPLLWSLPLLF